MDFLVPTFICLLVGIVLFIVEMFTPGLGIPSVLGTMAFVAALLLQIRNPTGMLFLLALILFLLAVGLIVFMKVIGSKSFAKSAIALSEEIGGISTNLGEQAMQAHTGQYGVAITPLRPAGKAAFEGETLDVSTSGEFLPAGATVRVSRVEGLRILVQSAQMPETEYRQETLPLEET